MKLKIKTVIIVLGYLFTLPASATIVSYDFTAKISDLWEYDCQSSSKNFHIKMCGYFEGLTFLTDFLRCLKR